MNFISNIEHNSQSEFVNTQYSYHISSLPLSRQSENRRIMRRNIKFNQTSGFDYKELMKINILNPSPKNNEIPKTG